MCLLPFALCLPTRICTFFYKIQTNSKSLFQLIHINQAHYDDIVEERSIVKLCGYPPCTIALGTIPKQQYVIASTQNKVYDITERKKFCSNKCYKSSVYLKEQILTTPLWVRKDDDVIPEFRLLSFDDNGKREENQSEKNVDMSEENLTDKQKENSVNKQLGESESERDKQKECEIQQELSKLKLT